MTLNEPAQRPALRAVLFDFGHTLVDFRRVPAALVRAYEEIRDRLLEHVDAQLPLADDLGRQITDAMDLIVRHSYRQGRLQELDMVELLIEAFAGIGIAVGGELAAELVALDHRAFSESTTVAPATFEVLETLAARGLAIGLVSNITLLGPLMRADLEALGLARFFGAVAFSSELGWRKPDERIFGHVLAGLGVPAEAAVFVGDRIYDDIAGAQQAGMRAVLTRQYRDELLGPERADALYLGEDTLSRIHPDAVIGHLTELPAALDRLSRPAIGEPPRITGGGGRPGTTPPANPGPG